MYLDNNPLICYRYEFLTCVLSQTCVNKRAKHPFPLKSAISKVLEVYIVLLRAAETVNVNVQSCSVEGERCHEIWHPILY